MRTTHNFHPATTLPDMPDADQRDRLAMRCRDSYADFDARLRNSEEFPGVAWHARISAPRRIQ
jgi:hypothetical protein